MCVGEEGMFSSCPVMGNRQPERVGEAPRSFPVDKGQDAKLDGREQHPG